MKFSEKITELRKQQGLTQEALAEVCQVSRQSISKWEAGLAFPELEKLLLLSETFQIPLDVLCKESFSLQGYHEAATCHSNALQEPSDGVFEGILIKESIDDERVLDHLTVHKVELWKTQGTPKYWTVLYFSSAEALFPEIVSRAMIGGEGKEPWFVDFKQGRRKFIVFRGKILSYTIGNATEKAAVREECKAFGITEEEMNWPD